MVDQWRWARSETVGRGTAQVKYIKMIINFLELLFTFP